MSYSRNGRAQKWYCLAYGLESTFKSCWVNRLFSSPLHPDQLFGLTGLPCKCTRDSFLGVKVARVWIWHLTTCVGEIKTAYSYTSSTPYITTVWCLIKNSNIIILSTKKETNMVTYKNRIKFNQNTFSHEYSQQKDVMQVDDTVSPLCIIFIDLDTKIKVQQRSIKFQILERRCIHSCL